HASRARRGRSYSGLATPHGEPEQRADADGDEQRLERVLLDDVQELAFELSQALTTRRQRAPAALLQPLCGLADVFRRDRAEPFHVAQHAARLVFHVVRTGM